MDLVNVSTSVLSDGQGESGAYVASPGFSQYRYAWLRDGSFCALAMAAVGRKQSSRRFHSWAVGAISALRGRLYQAITELENGSAVVSDQMMPTRYRMDGTVESGVREWPNFQLDGYGTWLFATYSCFGRALPSGFYETIVDVARYLSVAWHTPCYDCWEESGDRIHTSTLAAIAAGLRAASRMTGQNCFDHTADDILDFVGERCVIGGSFVKGVGDDRVDGSLLSLAVPFGLVKLTDSTFSNTLGRIRDELSSPSGGIRRYLGDQYYGGGPWILLTAWLGWCDRLNHHDDAYGEAVRWVEKQAGKEGTLPEQVLAEPQSPEWVNRWVERWGSVADPLLWSHANYLLLRFGGSPMSWSD